MITPALARSTHILLRALRTPSPAKPYHQKRAWSLLPNPEERRLWRLAEEANARSHDPEIQAAYLRALGKLRPTEVLRRVETGAFATGETVAREYLKALVATGHIDRVQLPLLLRTVGAGAAAGPGRAGAGANAGSGAGANAGAGASANAGASPNAGAGANAGAAAGAAGRFWGAGGAAAAAMGGKSGAAGEPIHVALADPSTQSQLWRAVRVLGTTFLVLGFLGVLIEERGMARGMGISTEMGPEPESTDPTTFDDVKGCDEAKAELEEIVQFLRAPASFTRLGGKLPKGLLLMGPPGTGKTLLARAIAGEAHRPFFYASGSEFEEMFVGVGAKRVRELFAAAKQHAPCIIFIDEIDAIGGKRNPKDQRFLTMTLNQFLVELDGFQSSEGIIVIGATNFPESLDKALVRPGRFDRHVIVPNPDIRGRTQILECHTKEIPLEDDVDLEVIARGTPGFSGAELANLVNMAALKAAIGNFMAVGMSHLEYAKDKILMGAERKSAALSEETRRTTAYHEGGHALCCLYTKDALPVHKATIMPRGQALGMVSQLPSKDMTSMSKAQMLAKLDVCMGGRGAEELIFGKEYVTSGASSDFQQATQLAEAMVTQYGMSEKLGLVIYEKERESTETRALIETEVRALLDASYARAMKVLRGHEAELHRLASALLAHETLTGEEVSQAVKGELAPPIVGKNVLLAEVRTGVAGEGAPKSAKGSSVLDAPNAVTEADSAGLDVPEAVAEE